MFRTTCLFLVLVTSGATFSQEDEGPTAESVMALYEDHGMPFYGAEDGRPVLLIFSSGCAHCVELATLYKEELTYLLTEEGFDARFIEMPGAIAQPEDEESAGDQQALVQTARESANSASMILECANLQSGEEALSMIADVGRAARLVAGTEPDPERPLTSNWANWPYLSGLDDNGQPQSTAVGVLQILAGARKIDLESCDQDAVWERLRVRHQAIVESGITYVPGLYLLPDEAFPRFMLWGYEDLMELVSNQ